MYKYNFKKLSKYLYLIIDKELLYRSKTLSWILYRIIQFSEDKTLDLPRVCKLTTVYVDMKKQKVSTTLVGIEISVIHLFKTTRIYFKNGHYYVHIKFYDS